MAEPKCILVVDDDPAVVETLTALLEDADYKVMSAVTGDQGEGKAVTEHPDLVILDVGMPGRDGLAVTSFLRSYPPTSKIPILILTGQGGLLTHIKSRFKGASYLTKPFQNEQLLSTIRGMLGEPAGS